jgi:glucose-6-phosphate 1-epimerase
VTTVYEAKSHRFDIPGVLHFEQGPGELTRAVISTPEADADIYLQGAHVAHWTPRGQRPVLFVSPKSVFALGKPIRGGVPVIFPWFGPRSDGKPGPSHGFARTLDWTVENACLRSDGKVEITFELSPCDVARGFGYGAFHLRYRVSIGAELELELDARNDAEEPLPCEEALHTYFAVGDVTKALVFGLDGTTYIDKTDGFQRKTLDCRPVRFSKEIDQVHVGAKGACVIHDPVWDRQIVIEKIGSHSTAMWNPWIEKTKTMSDMPSDGWKQMICVETANAADDAIMLPPGAFHKLRAHIHVRG